MGRLDNLPEYSESDDSQAASEALRQMTQDLRTLQQDLVGQLSQDVKRLQAEKSRLMNDIEKLQNQHQMLESQHEVVLSRQQLAQQQAWAKQLALVLANHLQAALSQRLSQMNLSQQVQGRVDLPQIPAGVNPEETYRLLASLDDTLNRSFTAMRNDLSSYQSALAQQLSHMQDLGQQGETILEVLVQRLSQHLQAEPGRASMHAFTDSGLPTNPAPHSGNPAPAMTTAPAVAPEPTPPVRSPVRPQRLSHFQIGLVLILLSTLALSLHNVVVGIVGNPSKLFGLLPIGGYIKLSFGSSLLILWMRMLVVVPLMAFLAGVLYKPVWRDIKGFALSQDKRLLGSVVGSGCFLFLSQVLIYISIGQIGPGVAVTILFMYPLITVPLAWVLFGDRPTRLRFGVMLAILLGVILTALPKLMATTTFSIWGVGAAAISGIAFACYLISMQISFRKLHPVPVSLIQFGTIFVLSSVSLIVAGVEVAPTNQGGLITSGLVLGTLTLLGYLLNNFGVRYMGAAQASIIAASGPVLTALLARLVIPGPFTTLREIQILGILTVTLGVTALSFERMLLQARAMNQKKPAS